MASVSAAIRRVGTTLRLPYRRSCRSSLRTATISTSSCWPWRPALMAIGCAGSGADAATVRRCAVHLNHELARRRAIQLHAFTWPCCMHGWVAPKRLSSKPTRCASPRRGCSPRSTAGSPQVTTPLIATNLNRSSKIWSRSKRLHRHRVRARRSMEHRRLRGELQPVPRDGEHGSRSAR